MRPNSQQPSSSDILSLPQSNYTHTKTINSQCAEPNFISTSTNQHIWPTVLVHHPAKQSGLQHHINAASTSSTNPPHGLSPYVPAYSPISSWNPPGAACSQSPAHTFHHAAPHTVSFLPGTTANTSVAANFQSTNVPQQHNSNVHYIPSAPYIYPVSQPQEQVYVYPTTDRHSYDPLQPFRSDQQLSITATGIPNQH